MRGPTRFGGLAEWGALAFVGVTLAGLSGVGRGGPWGAAVVAAVALIGAPLLRRGIRGPWREVALLPLLVALAWDASAATPSTLSELWAIGGGVALLAWLGSDPEGRARGASAFLHAGVLLPLVGALLAFATSRLLPVGSPAQEGLAGALVAAALILTGWMYASARREAREAGAAA
jgi:hypothetical protein